MDERLKLAEVQRFESLKNALNTVDQFATPSCNPEQYEEFDKLKAYLIEMYTPKQTNP